MDNIDNDNMRAMMIHIKNGSLDGWLETLSIEELEYALAILTEFHASREAFVNSL